MDNNRKEVLASSVRSLMYAENHLKGLSIMINTYLEDSLNNTTLHKIKNDAIDYQDNVHDIMELMKFTLDNIASNISTETSKLLDI